MTNSVMIECAGKCGRVTYTTKARASEYDEFLCDNAGDGDECLDRLPIPPGMVTMTTPKAAGGFAGIKFLMPDVVDRLGPFQMGPGYWAYGQRMKDGSIDLWLNRECDLERDGIGHENIAAGMIPQYKAAKWDGKTAAAEIMKWAREQLQEAR